MNADAVGTSLLHEAENARVWMLELEPGEATDWHQHECDYVYIVVEPGRNRTEYEDGTSHEFDDKVGDAVHVPKDKRHRLVNTGDRRYVNVVVELLSTTPK